MRKQLTSFATGNKDFVKYQAQRGGVNPNPPALRTPLLSLDFCEDKWYHKLNAQMNIQNTILQRVRK